MWIPTGSLSEEFRGILRSNETSAFLLEHLQEEITREELIDALLDEYDVDRERAEKDVDSLADMLRQGGLLE